MGEDDKTLMMESVPQCPLCHKSGKLLYEGLKDIAWPVPGEWNCRTCADCEILWLDPRPKPQSLSIVYPEDYVTHYAPRDILFLPRLGFVDGLCLEVKLEVLRRAYGYTLISSNPTARVLGMIAAHIPNIKRWVGYTVRFLPALKGRLLDVGCGNGEFILTMSNLGWRVQGVEPDSSSASLGRKAGLEIYEGTVESVPLEPNSFDAITLNHVIEHLPDPVGTLKMLSNALRPGGWLISISPNPSGLLARWFKTSWRALDIPRHFVLLSPRALVSTSQQVGLEPLVWTTPRNTKWVSRESISISRHGDTTTYRGRHLPNLIALVSRVLTILNRELGEEVVLVARKK